MKVAQGIKMHFCRSLKKELLIFSSWKMALAVIAQKRCRNGTGRIEPTFCLPGGDFLEKLKLIENAPSGMKHKLS